MKSIKIIILFIFLAVFTLFRPAVSSAQTEDLLVDWGKPDGTPLFKIENMAPGQTETREILVKNNTLKIMPVAIQGKYLIGDPELADKLIIIVSENGRELYGGKKDIKTLSQFLNDSAAKKGISLGNLKAQDQTKYVISVGFDAASGNSLQEKSYGFDLAFTGNTNGQGNNQTSLRDIRSELVSRIRELILNLFR